MKQIFGKKKLRGIEALKRRYGIMFVAPWIFGFIVFMLFPLASSIQYAFSHVVVVSGGIETTFVGLKNFKKIILEDPSYIDSLVVSVSSLFLSLPIIITLSLCFAIILNQRFRGRLFARAIFFLPVIIASGVVMNRLWAVTGGEISQSLVRSDMNISSSVPVIDFEAILRSLQLPERVNSLLSGYLSSVFDLVWSCGIQTLLFIAGLQTIPKPLYEVAKVEGATVWETFWYVTVPMLGRVITLVLVYTVVESFITFGSLAETVLDSMRWNNIYDITSAKLWVYFAVVGGLLGLIVFIYNRLCLKRWE